MKIFAYFINLVILLFSSSLIYAADAAGAENTQQSIMSMLPLFLIFVLFMYFMVIRPQSKRVKEHKSLLDTIKHGDEVMVCGGIIGEIEKINNDFIVLNISKDNNILIRKSAISSILPKGTIKSER